MIIRVKCIDGKWPAWKCNTKLKVCEEWLNENCGKRWADWDWDREYGVVLFYPKDGEIATMCKLVLGI